MFNVKSVSWSKTPGVALICRIMFSYFAEAAAGRASGRSSLSRVLLLLRWSPEPLTCRRWPAGGWTRPEGYDPGKQGKIHTAFRLNHHQILHKQASFHGNATKMVYTLQVKRFWTVWFLMFNVFLKKSLLLTKPAFIWSNSINSKLLKYFTI